MPKQESVAHDPTHLGNAESGQLRAFIERVERMNEEIKALSDDRKDIFAEAKGHGFDVKQMRRVIKIRAQDREKWEEEEQILDLYLSALGLL
jgi:uncharacterized protein (UPF0335 family)